MIQPISGQIPINSENDIIVVRRTIRDSAKLVGFSGTDITRIVTAASELARNIYKYATSGMVRYKIVQDMANHGITIIFADQGPGIPDIELAMQPGYSSSKSLGMGLSGCRRLMDVMEIESDIGKGTQVTISKWLN